MQTLVVRVEASSGSYTDTPGQTRAVFDSQVSAGYVETLDGFITPEIIEEGRDAVGTIKGARINASDYDSNVGSVPYDYYVEPISIGMFVDNITQDEQIPDAAARLCEKGGKWKIFSVIGQEDVAELVTQLFELDSDKGRYLGNLILVAANYAARDIPG